MLPNPLFTLDPKVLGERLRGARRARGFTQEQIVNALGYARTTIVAIEKGERRVTSKELIGFARRYGRRVSDFVSQEANTHPLVPQFRSGPPTARAVTTPAESEYLAAAEQLKGPKGVGRLIMTGFQPGGLWSAARPMPVSRGRGERWRGI